MFYELFAHDIYLPNTKHPRCAVTTPAAGSVVNGTFNATVYAADDVRFDRVDRYVDNTNSVHLSVGWSFPWAIQTGTGSVDGTHTFWVRGYDDAEDASPLNGPSTFTISNPRVNCGGSGFVDGNGNFWFADEGYSSGGASYSTTNVIADADMPALYQSERSFPEVGTYQFPVSNGTRQMKPRFAEIFFWQPGQRAVNVKINGQQVLANVDVFVAAGGAFRAIDRTFTTNVTNQTVTIEFDPMVERSKISAIEIH